MRSNYNPYPQHGKAELNARLQEIEVAKRQVLLANDNLAKVLSDQIPLLLRHHTQDRALVKLSIDQVKREMQASNSGRVTATDHAWAVAMADIESIRAEYHSKQQAKTEQERIKKQERATLSFDETMRQYYIMRNEEVTNADGKATMVARKVYLPENHEYLK